MVCSRSLQQLLFWDCCPSGIWSCPAGAPCKIVQKHLWFSDPCSFIAFSRLELRKKCYSWPQSHSLASGMFQGNWWVWRLICICCLLGLPISYLAPEPPVWVLQCTPGARKNAAQMSLVRAASLSGCLLVCAFSPKSPSHIQKGWRGTFVSTDHRMDPVLEIWWWWHFDVTVAYFFSQPYDPPEMLSCQVCWEHENNTVVANREPTEQLIELHSFLQSSSESQRMLTFPSDFQKWSGTWGGR